MFKPGTNTNSVQQARIRKTKWFFENRQDFMLELFHDIRKAIRFARRRDLTPVFRLNGTSDLAWEKYTLDGYNVFELFPEVQFYDYTKILGRKVADYPNYHLTFSRAEDNMDDCLKAQKEGMNVAVVYDRIPAHVYSADEDDLRFLDPFVAIVGLKAKGRAKKDTSGFVVRT